MHSSEREQGFARGPELLSAEFVSEEMHRLRFIMVAVNDCYQTMSLHDLTQEEKDAYASIGSELLGAMAGGTVSSAEVDALAAKAETFLQQRKFKKGIGNA